MIGNCALCKAKRELIVKLDDEDCKVYELIINGLNTAKMAYNTEVIPEALSKDEIKKYYEKIIESEIYYTTAQSEWWRLIHDKYNVNLTNYIKVDTLNGELYHCLDSEGNEVLYY
jgi:hypothetical protein